MILEIKEENREANNNANQARAAASQMAAKGGGKQFREV